MASARLPGGINRASMVRHALLALGPDEWLRTDVMARWSVTPGQANTR